MPNRLMTNKELALIGLLAGAILLGALTLLITSRGQQATPYPVAETPDPVSTAPQPDPGGTAAAADNTVEPDTIVVEVKGAVHDPGVYSMTADQRVDDLLKTAGGPTADANLDNINRAARLVDATSLVVPGKGDATQGPDAMGTAVQAGISMSNPADYTVGGGTMESSGNGRAGGGRVNINTANQAALETLPRVGPVTAEKIIDHRRNTPFQSVDDLAQIHGIGEKTVENLRPHVAVR
ncbi:MAG: helix-hairpin-helix domain-containing protein [Candidatus Hydrogenedentota bacterium]